MSLMPSRGAELLSPMSDDAPMAASTTPARAADVETHATAPAASTTHVAAATTQTTTQAVVAQPPVAKRAFAAKPATTTHVGAPAPIGHPSPVGAGTIGGALLALVMVVGLILALGWIARRLPGMRAGNRTAALRVVDSLTLGPRERVVVVAVGHAQLLLGVGAGGTRLLHTLEQPLPAPTASPTAPAFAQLLAQHFGKKQ